MPGATSTMPTALTVAVTIVWFLLMGGVFISYVIIVVAAWRMMKAHEKLANKVNEVADRLQLK